MLALPIWKMVLTVKKPRFLVKIDEKSIIGERVGARWLELKLRQSDVASLLGVTEDALTLLQSELSIPRI